MIALFGPGPLNMGQHMGGTSWGTFHAALLKCLALGECAGCFTVRNPGGAPLHRRCAMVLIHPEPELERRGLQIPSKRNFSRGISGSSTGSTQSGDSRAEGSKTSKQTMDLRNLSNLSTFQEIDESGAKSKRRLRKLQRQEQLLQLPACMCGQLWTRVWQSLEKFLLLRFLHGFARSRVLTLPKASYSQLFHGFRRQAGKRHVWTQNAERQGFF